MRKGIVALGLFAAMCVVAEGGSGASEAGDREFVLREFSFAAPAGWSHATAESENSADSMAWVANVPVPSRSSWTFPPEEMLRELPPDGIAVTLEVNREKDTCAPNTVLHMAENDVMSGDYEGQPAEHVSSGSSYAVQGEWCLYAQAWFGVSQPSESQLEAVNDILGSVELTH